MKLYIFNPDTDMALANNEENYMAPLSARCMAQDLALLPIWYAQPGSGVLASSAYNTDFLKQMRQLFPLSVQLITEPELPDYADSQIVPWGWNPSIRKRLLKGGILEHKLPMPEELALYRKMASRERVTDWLKAFRELENCHGMSANLYKLSDCKEFVNSSCQSVLKAPWSGSGKGLRWCEGAFTPSVSGWCERILREQGAVVASLVYNKVEDFAMEFYADGCGQLLFVGYSSFTTNSKGAYMGNLLIPAEEFEKRITNYVPLPTLIQVREKLQEALAACSHIHTGYFGVDMMIWQNRETNKYLIHPCIEVNLRMNMGVVAHLFQQNYLAPDRIGQFMVEYYPSCEDLQTKHRQDTEAAPLVVENGRLASGYLPLVPVTPKSYYRAYVRVLHTASI